MDGDDAGGDLWSISMDSATNVILNSIYRYSLRKGERLLKLNISMAGVVPFVKKNKKINKNS